MNKKERNDNIFRQYQSGETITGLAREYKISRAAIYAIVKRIAVRDSVPLRDKIPVTSKVRLAPNEIDQYKNGEISGRNLASRHGISETTLYKVLKRGDVKRNKGISDRIGYSYYELYIGGRTAREIAELEKVNVRRVEYYIARYRKRHKLGGKICLN